MNYQHVLITIFFFFLKKMHNTTSMSAVIYLQAQLNIVLVHPQSSTS